MWSQISRFIIRVIENGEEKYLFSTRVLLYDPALAKKFSSPLLANRYWKKSLYKGLIHTIIPDPYELAVPQSSSAIVE